MEESWKSGLFICSSQRALVDIPFGAIFALCFTFSKVHFFSYLALFTLGIYFVYLILFCQNFIIKYLAIIFPASSAIVGTAIVEFAPQFYLTELQCYSKFAGSLPLLILSYWLLMAVLLNYDAVYGVEVRGGAIRADEKSTKKTLTIITFVVLLLFLALFSRVVTHPAFLLGVDRFVYASEYAVSGILLIIDRISVMLIVFPILLMLYGNKILGFLTILVYILYYLWIGNKFGPFFTFMCVFLLICYQDIIKKGKKFLNKIIVIACSLFVFVFAYAVTFTSMNSNYYNPVSYIMQRGAQQGQLWWKTYDLYNGEIHPSEFDSEFKAIIDGKDTIVENIGSSNGIYRIMYLCAPKSVVDSKLSTGSRYTEAGLASVYYYFGSTGVLLFSAICGFVFALMINSFLKAVNNKEYIKVMVILKLFLWGLEGLSMFVFNDFFDILTLMVYLYLVFMWDRKLSVTLENGILFKLKKYKRLKKTN